MKAEKSILPDVGLPLVQVEWGAMTHPGKVRPNNEDHYLVAAFERSMRALLTSLPEGEIPDHCADTGYGILVADGVSGEAGGEVASRTAIRALIELALGTPDWIMRLNEELAQEVLQRLSQRIKQVGVALIEKARVDPRLTGMATTMTLACSLGANLLIAHVGDSRAYLFRQGQLYRLTSDHTVAQALAKAGWIGLEDVASHPLRNRLTQVVGSTGDKALADLGTVQLMDGDQVLLCTDGLTDMVEEAAITQALTLEGTAAAVCRALVEMALEGGGRDNITVVLGRYRIPQ